MLALHNREHEDFDEEAVVRPPVPRRSTGQVRTCTQYPCTASHVASSADPSCAPERVACTGATLCQGTAAEEEKAWLCFHVYLSTCLCVCHTVTKTCAASHTLGSMGARVDAALSRKRYVCVCVCVCVCVYMFYLACKTTISPTKQQHVCMGPSHKSLRLSCWLSEMRAYAIKRISGPSLCMRIHTGTSGAPVWKEKLLSTWPFQEKNRRMVYTAGGVAALLLVCVCVAGISQGGSSGSGSSYVYEGSPTQSDSCAAGNPRTYCGKHTLPIHENTVLMTVVGMSMTRVQLHSTQEVRTHADTHKSSLPRIWLIHARPYGLYFVVVDSPLTGDVSIDKGKCEALGCCWSPAKDANKNVPSCFHPNAAQSMGQYKVTSVRATGALCYICVSIGHLRAHGRPPCM